jgi:cytidylate kinase
MNVIKSLSAVMGYLGASIQQATDHDLYVRQSYPAVTITRQTGARAISIGKLLISQLHEKQDPEAPPWTLFEKDLIKQVLRNDNLPEDLAKFFPEDPRHYLDDTMEEIAGLHPPAFVINEKCHQLLKNLCKRGHVVIIGRCGNILTCGMPSVLKVRLVGSLQVRIQSIVKLFEFDEKQAMAYLKKEDILRKRYAKENFGITDIDNPLLYDLVINTDHLPDASIAKIIEELLWAKVDK